MKKTLVTLTAAMAITVAAHASDIDKNLHLRFTDIPYAEGTLYIAVSCGDDRVLATAVEVTGDTVIIPVDLIGHTDNTISIQAFQDLNGNSLLDFDSFGRPQEPCLQTSLMCDSTEDTFFDLKLIQY